MDEFTNPPASPTPADKGNGDSSAPAESTQEVDTTALKDDAKAFAHFNEEESGGKLKFAFIAVLSLVILGGGSAGAAWYFGMGPFGATEEVQHAVAPVIEEEVVEEVAEEEPEAPVDSEGTEENEEDGGEAGEGEDTEEESTETEGTTEEIGDGGETGEVSESSLFDACMNLYKEKENSDDPAYCTCFSSTLMADGVMSKSNLMKIQTLLSDPDAGDKLVALFSDESLTKTEQDALGDTLVGCTLAQLDEADLEVKWTKN